MRDAGGGRSACDWMAAISALLITATDVDPIAAVPVTAVMMAAAAPAVRVRRVNKVTEMSPDVNAGAMRHFVPVGNRNDKKIVY